MDITGCGGKEVNIHNQSDTVTVCGYATVHAGDGNSLFDFKDGGKLTVGNGCDTINMAGSGTIIEKGASGHDTITLSISDWGKHDSISVGSGHDTQAQWGSGKTHVRQTDTIYEQGHATV